MSSVSHITPRSARVILALSLVLLLAACGSDTSSGQVDAVAAPVTEATQAPIATTAPLAAPVESAPDASESPTATVASSETTTVTTSLVPDPSLAFDTTAGVLAARWGDNVTVTLDENTWRFESDGLPSHEIPDQFLVPQTGSFTPPVTESEVRPVDSSVAVVATPIDQTTTLNPTYVDAVTDTNLGRIGVTISGAQLFNDYEDPNRSFVAVDDNFSVDGIFFVDSCNGHPLALLADGTGSGNYHYHGVPYCITDVIDVAGEHSAVLGFLIDGFPFYGPQDAAGVKITSDELDECSGHFGPTPEFPEGTYHYHLTEDRSPYTVDCYHGAVEASTDAGGPAGGDRPPAGDRPEGGVPPADGAAPADGAGPPADGDRPEGGVPPADGAAPADGAGPPADGEAPAGGGGPGGPPDFAAIAAQLGVSQADLEAALGQPPFDFAAAAAALGISEAALEAALPAPPGR